MRVLVAEDDNNLRSVLARGLREAGYVVDTAADGDAALRHLNACDYAVAVIDWRMPGLSGLEVIGQARRVGRDVPVLMLTARDTPRDRVAGLDGGADDYLVKPFNFSELTARIRALSRRPAGFLPAILRCGTLELDPATRTVTCGGEAAGLTPTEFGILEVLMRKSPNVVHRRALAVSVWDSEASTLGSNTIDVHMARLRAKLARGDAVIETVKGIGYRLDVS